MQRNTPAVEPASISQASPARVENAGTPDLDPLVVAIWESVQQLRDRVENDHDHRLRRIESDLHWVTFLLAAEIVALLGAAIAALLGGG